MTTHPNPNPEPTLFLTVEETAHQLRCTPRHVRNLITRGELASVKMGRSVRVPRSALVALADAAAGGKTK